MENMVNFWKGRKVLVTGHTGFKGCWMALWLQSMQAEVIGVALDPPTSPNLFTLLEMDKSITDIRCDIRDFEKLAALFKQHNPEIVFHMAAQPLVRYSYEHPIETYQTNVMGTVHVLEALKACSNVRAIVNVTTDKCYENKEWPWGYREIEPMGGFDPYSSSKGCSELITSAYRSSYFNSANVGLASARAGNVIGGGDWAQDRLIPDLITACIQQVSLEIRYPHATRPWQHVLEPLSGYLCLAEQLYNDPQKYAESWNFGPRDTEARTVGWIADEVLKNWGTKLKWTLAEKEQVHEATYLKLDCSKAATRLHWTPRWDIQKTLDATVSWYKAHDQKADMHAFTLAQIAEYSQP